MKVTLRFLILSMLAAGMSGCPPKSNCLVGQEIVIPSADATAPSLVMDFHLPDGKIVTVTPGSATSPVLVPGGGRVTVIVNAKDPEGIQDAQIWAADIKTTGGVSQGPGLLGAPTTSNRDNGSAGQKGCTERVATTNLDVRTSSTGSVSFEVHAVGINFGGKSVNTPLVRVVAQ